MKQIYIKFQILKESLQDHLKNLNMKLEAKCGTTLCVHNVCQLWNLIFYHIIETIYLEDIKLLLELFIVHVS